MVTTVTNNSPQSINTSLFSLDRDIQEIKKVTDKLKDISLESDVISVNGKRGIVELNASDVGALPDTTVIPTKTSDLENDSGFVTMEDVAESYVPLTRTINDKPLDEDITLTASDVGALPDTTVIPTKTSDLENDSGFITSSDSITGNAATATRAEQDADGNVITDTYATKTELDNKVDKVTGKGLSANDYTTEEKEKLAGLSNYDDSAVKTLIANETKAREDADKVLQTAIDGKAAASHNHDDRYYTETEINEKIYDINEKIGTLQENKNDLLDMCSDLYDKVADETSSRTEADTALQNQITANKSAIDTLNGTGEGSVQKTVTDEIAKVVANAPEDFDTLKEISDWIDTHKDSASAMNTAIQANATAISDEAKARADADTALQTAINGKANSSHTHTKSQITDFAHNHDDRYFTETEITNKLAGKSDTGHTHTKSQITDFAHTHDDRYYTETEVTNKLAGKSDKGHTHTKSEITDFAHNHDDRYYTESEVDTKLSGKSDTGHKHSASDITSGTLAVARGGTGQTTLNASANSLINSLTTGSSTPTDNDYYVSQYAGGGTTTTTYHRRPVSQLWEYIKSKISSVLGLTATNYGGKAATAGTADRANALAYRDTIQNTDTFQNVMNNDGKWRITDLNPGWNGSLYSFHAGGSQSGLMFRIVGGKNGSNQVQVNYSIDGNRFGMNWATLINSENIGSQTVARATQDASGNVITDTYATKTELSGKSDTGHTHDDRYYTETEVDTKLSGKLDIKTIAKAEDINTALDAGYYKYPFSNTTYVPVGNYGVVIVYNGNGSYIKQIYIPDSINQIYYRKYTSSSKTWGSWIAIANKSDIPTSLPANGGTADKATKDGNGNNIADTYMPKSGGTFTGIVTGNEFHATSFFPKDNIDSQISFYPNADGDTKLIVSGYKSLKLDSSEGDIFLKSEKEENALNKVVAKSYKVCKNSESDPNIPTFLSNAELTDKHKKILRKIFGAICLGKCLSLNLEVNYAKPGSTKFNTFTQPFTIIGGQDWDFGDATINADGVTFDNAVNVSNTYSYLGGINDNGDFYSVDAFELVTDIIRNDFSNVKGIQCFATIMENWV